MSLASPVIVLQPFLKAPDARFYHTDLIPDVAAHESLLTCMVGILHSRRLKNLKSTKVGFSFTELDSLFKSLFLLEILSFSSSTLEVLGECFMDLKARLSPDHRPVALEYASFLRCLDKATRHGIGEAVNVYANLLLKKREHLMSLSSPSVPSSIKS